MTITSSTTVARVDDAVAEVLHHAEQAGATEGGGQRGRAHLPLERAEQQRDEERDERQRRGDAAGCASPRTPASPTASAAAPISSVPR